MILETAVERSLPLAGLQKLGIVGYAELLRLARVCKNSTLGRVQRPFLG